MKIELISILIKKFIFDYYTGNLTYAKPDI